MLTIYQNEKVAIALKLIKEVQDQVRDTDIHKTILLGDAAEACDEVLKQDLPEGYVSPPKEEAWYSPESVRESLPSPTIGDRILNILGWIAGTSLLSSALCGCIALSSWGLSEFKGALDTKILQETDFAAETKGYRGLAIAFFGVTLSASVLGAVVGDAVYRSND